MELPLDKAKVPGGPLVLKRLFVIFYLITCLD